MSSLSSCTETIPVAWFTLGPAVLELADGQVSPLDGAWFRQVIRPQLLAAGDTQPGLGVVSVIHLAGHVHTVVPRNSPRRLAWARARPPPCLRAP
ncbi:MAG: hypothetical protein WAL99_19530 [Pseudonocardiaceae bacterium]